MTVSEPGPTLELLDEPRSVHHGASWQLVSRPVSAVFLASAAAVVVLGVLGVVALQARPAWERFHLDGEGTVPAYFSGVLLAACCVTATVALVRIPAARWPLRALALLFGAMAVDEVLAAHEWAERHSGIDWQLLYAPVIAVGAVAYLLVGWAVRGERVVRMLWVAGGTAWGVSQVLEFAQWDGNVPRAGYYLMMVPEELLEMTGSALWLVALLAMTVPGARGRLIG